MRFDDSSLVDAARAVANGQRSARRLVEDSLSRIGAAQASVNAFSRVMTMSAREDARRAEASSMIGPLQGVPVAVKDLIDVEGEPTEGGSDAYRGRVADRDAVVVTRLRQAGAIVVGKTHTHEIAFGVATPQVSNPWSVGYQAGGSSGGSGAAVAAGQVFAALGTDTGGSIRIPAAHCGVTGIKPTLGVVPTDGVMGLSWTCDVVGPLARSAEDCAVVLRVLIDGGETSSFSGDPLAVSQMRIGVATGWWVDGIDDEVAACVGCAAEVLAGLGASWAGVEVEHADEAAEIGASLVGPEAAVLHAEAIQEGVERFAPEVRVALESGRALPAVEYLGARARRRALIESFDATFADVDVLVAPVTAFAAPARGVEEIDGVPLLPASIRFTVPASVAGLPAVSIPCGVTRAGLPVGVQLVGRRHSDFELLALATAFQQQTDWHLRCPKGAYA